MAGLLRLLLVVGLAAAALGISPVVEELTVRPVEGHTTYRSDIPHAQHSTAVTD